MAKHYLILEADSIDELMDMVNEHLDAHYEPLGGMVADANLMYYQTMLRNVPGAGSAKKEHEAHKAIEEDLADED